MATLVRTESPIIAPHSPKRAGRISAWLSDPRRALLGAVLILTGAVGLDALSDPDVWWHIRLGDWIIAHHQIPAGELFAYTAFGNPLVAHEWLSETIFAALAAIGGLLLVTVLMGRLGANVIVLTNAAGGLHVEWPPGTLMVMRDHINLTGRSPLIGPNADDLGPRFPDLTDAWSPRLRAGLHAAAAAEGIDFAEGIYVGLTGPTYETPAEVRMLASLGGDAVGMSTVLECIAARWVGLEVCGVSLVTNSGAGYSGEPLTHEEGLAAGRIAGPRLAKVIRRFVADLPAA